MFIWRTAFWRCRLMTASLTLAFSRVIFLSSLWAISGVSIGSSRGSIPSTITAVFLVFKFPVYVIMDCLGASWVISRRNRPCKRNPLFESFMGLPYLNRPDRCLSSTHPRFGATINASDLRSKIPSQKVKSELHPRTMWWKQASEKRSAGVVMPTRYCKERLIPPQCTAFEE